MPQKVRELTKKDREVIDANDGQRYVYNKDENDKVVVHRDICDRADAENDRTIRLDRALRDYPDQGCPTCLPYRVQTY